MYCPSCKSPNPIYRKYCLNCRLALNGSGNYEPGYSPTQESNQVSRKDEEKAKAKGKWMLDKIESREDALKFVRDASIAFFVVSALQAVMSILIGMSVMIDASIYALSSFFLLRFQSRVAALALLLLAFAATCVTISNIYKGNVAAATGVVISLITLIIAGRAVEASFKLHGRFALTGPNKPSSTT